MEDADLRESFEIIEDSNDAREEFGHAYGSEIKEITEEDIEALKQGKMLATIIQDGEYSCFIRLHKEEENDQRN